MNSPFDLALYVGVLVTLSYLIYRYARYSKWEDSDVGRAFMWMKLCLLALSIYSLAVLLGLDGLVQDIVRLVVVGGIWVSLTNQVLVMLRLQGGLRRDKPVQRWIPEEPIAEPTDSHDNILKP